MSKVFEQVKEVLRKLNPLKEQTITIYGKNQPKQEQQSPIVNTIQAAPITQTPQSTRLSGDLITNMIKVYGGDKAPILPYSGQIAQMGSQYRFWQDNPELLALLPHLETSSGKNVTRPNNWTNWGIAVPGNNETFSTMQPIDVYGRMVSGIGERKGNYAKFRTGAPLTDDELLEFAKIYEPANPDYGPNLVQGRKHIKSVVGNY
jgi:hypothetical protein